MSDFYIVPPRKIVGSLDGINVVTSLNSLKGDLSLSVNPSTGLRLNVSNGIFTFSVQDNFYIKKSGDTVNSNIIFAPSDGNYGLAVGSGATDPVTGIAGALFFNTNDTVLKVYDGSAWNEIASTGTSGITQSFADNRYLRLDGGNVPTAAISMGNQFLRFANLTTRTLPGLSGQLYFNTDNNKIEFYNGSSWTPVGNGITSLSAGVGISLSSNPITTQGSISVDQTYNYNWTGTHTHSNPITFASAQQFDASKLTIASQTAGDILYYNGSNWARLGVGTTNQVLSVSNAGNGVTWHSLAAGSGISIAYSSGQLVFSNTGGTGSGTGLSMHISEYPPVGVSVGDLWFNTQIATLNVFYNDGNSSQWVEVNIPLSYPDPIISSGLGLTRLNDIGSSSQYLYTGSDGINFNIVSIGNSHTFNIPIAGSGKTGLISGLAQTFSGNKTFSDGIISSTGATIFGELQLPNTPLKSIYGGTGYSNYDLGDLLVGAGNSFVKLPKGPNRYVLQSNISSASGLGWTSISGVAITTSPPADNIEGDLWFNSYDGSLSVWYIDEDYTGVWVEIEHGPGSGGASGSGGSGIVELNGLNSTIQSFSVGSSGNYFNINSTTQTHTFNIPLAGSASTGLITNLSQTIAGSKTFTADTIFTSQTSSTTKGTGSVTIYGGLGVSETLTANNVVINNYSDILSNIYTSSNTSSNQVMHSVSSSTYRSLKYIISVSSGSEYHSEEVLLNHDGSTVYMTEYAQILSGSGNTLSSFDSDINSGNIRLLVTPNNSVTQYIFSCTAIRA